jgi:NTE family protein
MKKIGLALGGGGAKGLAHIPLLDVFDELNIRPHCITGTSIGAIMGALYASGIKAQQIRDRVQSMVISKGDSFKAILKKKDALKWIQFLDVDFRGIGLFRGDKFIDFLYKSMGVKYFEDLKIPLRVVASDFWTSEQVVLDQGELLPAVKASMGLPGVFTPVTLNDRILIDGGGVNPVPHDLLTDCDVVIAINVMGRMSHDPHRPPNLFRAVLGTFDIMQNSIVKEKHKHNPPDILIRPDIHDIDILEFYKADEVYEQAAPAREKLKRQLERLVD